MKKFLLSLMVASCVFPASAQQVSILKNEKLLDGAEHGAYYPVLSADGAKLLFTGADNRGLKMYDFDDNTVKVISEEERAGYAPKISNDGNIYYVVQSMAERKVHRTVKSYNIVNGTDRVVVEGGYHKVASPILSTSGRLVLKDEARAVDAQLTEKSDIAVFVDGSSVVIDRGGQRVAYSPVESQAGYLWASLSPDNTKVLFFAAGKGAFVMNLDGKILSHLGKYEMPCWFGNDYVVAQNATDDGHQFTSSQIMLLKADGSFKLALTSPESMTMQPTAAIAANRIVYSTIDGNLYLMEIKITD